MAHKHCYEALDITLRDLMRTVNAGSSNQLFGGKVVILGGHFRQVLPVVPRGSRSAIVNAGLQSSRLWQDTKVVRLPLNMRVQQLAGTDPQQALRQQEFADMLLAVGEQHHGNLLRIPPGMALSGSHYKDLVERVSGDLQHGPTTRSQEALLGRAILAPKNSDVNDINDYVCSLFPLGDGEQEHESFSADSVGQDDNGLAYQTEYLNTLQPQGFPPHHLKLKKGLPIMLLRNISSTLGLTNGTRLIVTGLRQHVIKAKILTCSPAHVDTEALIPRCTLTSKADGLPFELIRRQFPVRPAFAMTINKSQGQTFKHVGVFLLSPVFSHGQLYVAMSRVGQASGLSIMLAHPRPARAPPDGALYTYNVVYTEVFNALPAVDTDENW